LWVSEFPTSLCVSEFPERVRDPATMRHAAKRMDRMREEMRHRVGNVNLAVPLVRVTRDEE
jgi:hypothetical protein